MAALVLIGALSVGAAYGDELRRAPVPPARAHPAAIGAAALRPM